MNHLSVLAIGKLDEHERLDLHSFNRHTAARTTALAKANMEHVRAMAEGVGGILGSKNHALSAGDGMSSIRAFLKHLPGIYVSTICYGGRTCSVARLAPPLGADPPALWSCLQGLSLGPSFAKTLQLLATCIVVLSDWATHYAEH